MTAETLWAARLHLNSGAPPTLLDTEMIRAICEAYVEAESRDECGVDGIPRCSGEGKTEADWCRMCLVANFRIEHHRANTLWQLREADAREAESRCREEVLKEREACAKVADACHPGAPSDAWLNCQAAIAEAIRARKP